MADRNDYSGPFDPDFRYEDLSKEALVRLVHEYALIVHLLDRSMCAAIGIRYGADMVNELAIEEWRGASPIYGDRLREIMAVEGDGIEAIFKVLQLDPGFPHHYMDVHYEVVDDRHGYFELRSCGALMDVEPWGDRMVTGMCHTIEDGTFDVTAQAVNPKARVRAVHRPPRVPSDRVPHCRWEVVIDEDTETLPDADITTMTRTDRGGHLPFPGHAGRHAPHPPARGGRRAEGQAVTEAAVAVLAAEASRRRLTVRQVAVVEQLVEAAADEAREQGYDGRDRPQRGPARRRGPATAYTYFASKDHLLAEVLWRRLQALPGPACVGSNGAAGPTERVVAELRVLGLFMADDPMLAAACTTALLGSGPEVRALRVLFGTALHERLAHALGDGADETVLRSLDLAYSGAMLWAGMGHIRYRGRARRPGRRGPTGAAGAP